MRTDTYLKRFYSKITETPKGCWEWQGFRNSQGYGAGKHKKETLAHRISFILHHGPLLEGMCVLHRCDNPPCVNPDHLFIGDRNINNKDRAAKGRTVNRNRGKTHCYKGHPFDENNTSIRPNGSRKCRKCAADRTAQVIERRITTGKKINYKNKYCRYGHEYTLDNTYFYRDGNRLCRECNRQKGRENYRKKKVAQC